MSESISLILVKYVVETYDIEYNDGYGFELIFNCPSYEVHHHNLRLTFYDKLEHVAIDDMSNDNHYLIINYCDPYLFDKIDQSIKIINKKYAE